MSSNTGNSPTNTKSGGTGRRRSSAAQYSGLMSQKRNSSDAVATARKASFAEQTTKPGFLGGMWHSFTKGNGK